MTLPKPDSDYKKKAYAELVSAFEESVVVAEEDFTAQEIHDAFVEAVDKQIEYYITKQVYYSQLLAAFK